MRRSGTVSWVVDAAGCWIWHGRSSWQRHATVMADGKMRGAHRVVYELFRGEIPAGLVLDHLCRVPACVNPAHLEPVTQRENVLRGESVAAAHARRTLCPRGHEYDAVVKASGRRRCSICHAAGNLASYHRLRARESVCTQ